MQGASAAGKSAQMGLSQLGGVFIVLSGGMIMSCFIAVIEFMWENRKVSSQGVRININIIQEISQFLVSTWIIYFKYDVSTLNIIKTTYI